jgi:NAD(P)H-flavin reductase
MVCGGTGITPMYQVIQQIIAETPAPNIKIWLVFANKTEEDILLRQELENYPINLFKVLDDPPTGWTQGAGFITEDILRGNLPPPGNDTLMVQCGPPPMTRLVNQNLVKIGHQVDHIFKF